ncbi:hypothetical protein K525DRAFT_246922 [Schizophyllum commune Loenen D]|nr:hypothetical protein K525DRAFT_246922 [Schizophyllum commune Loenen D]
MSAFDYRDGLRPYAESSCRTGLDDLPDETYVVPEPSISEPLPLPPAPPAFVWEQAPSRLSILDPSRAPPPTQAQIPIWMSTFRFPTPPPAPSPPRQVSPPPAPIPARKASRASARKSTRSSAPKPACASARKASSRVAAAPPPKDPKIVLRLSNFAFDNAQPAPAPAPEAPAPPPKAPAPASKAPAASKALAAAPQAPAPAPRAPTQWSGRLRAAARKPAATIPPPPATVSKPAAKTTSPPAKTTSYTATKKGSAKASARSTKAPKASKNAQPRSIAPLPARARMTASTPAPAPAPARKSVPAREIAPLPARARSTRSNSAASSTRSRASTATLVPSRASSKGKERAVSPIPEEEVEETDCEEPEGDEEAAEESDEEGPESDTEAEKTRPESRKEKGGRQIELPKYDTTTDDAKKLIKETAETMKNATGSQWEPDVHDIVVSEMMDRFRQERAARAKRQRLNAAQGTAQKPKKPLKLRERIERHRTDEMVKWFAAHTVVCAACNMEVGTDIRYEAYYSGWNKHKLEKCQAILTWDKQPPSQETMKEWQRARNKCADGMLKVYPDAIEQFGGHCVCEQLGLEVERRAAVAAQKKKRAEARAGASA